MTEMKAKMKMKTNQTQEGEERETIRSAELQEGRKPSHKITTETPREVRARPGQFNLTGGEEQAQ